MVRLFLPVGSYDVRIETRALRTARVRLCLGFFFNRHRVPPAALHFDHGRLAFRMHPSMFDRDSEQRLILTCNPLRPWKAGVPDRRELGLPIFSIRFTPVEGGVRGGDEPGSSMCSANPWPLKNPPLDPSQWLCNHVSSIVQ